MFFSDFALLVWPISWHKVGGVYGRYHSWPPGGLTDVLGSFHRDSPDMLMHFNITRPQSLSSFKRARVFVCVSWWRVERRQQQQQRGGCWVCRLRGMLPRPPPAAVYSPLWFFHWLQQFGLPVFWKKTTKSEHVSRCYLNISTHLRVCLKRSRAWRCWVWGPLLPLSGCWHCRRLMLRPAALLESTEHFQNGSTFVLKIGFVYVLLLQ